MHIFQVNILIFFTFFMSSTCFEPEGASSGRQKSVFNSIEHTLLPTTLLILMHVKRNYNNSIYNRLPEDEPSGSKHVEDTKLKTLIYKNCILLVYIV